MKKGISPLIAAVILIAFVIAVAGIASAFFTDIADEWGGKVEDEEPISCSVASVEIDGDTWNSGNVTVYVRGSELTELGLTVQDQDGDTAFTNHTVSGNYQPGRSYRLTGNELPSGTVDSLTVTTPDCNGVEDSVEV